MENTLHKKLLYLLDMFIELCDKLDVKWFVDGGTLLGTIRSNSFIEWDDDIDICMHRHEFERLTRYMRKHPHYKHCFFQDPVTDPNYFNIHARLRLDGTTAISKREFLLHSHKGIFIDIYPIDCIPDDTTNLIGFMRAICKDTDVEAEFDQNKCLANKAEAYKAIQLMLDYTSLINRNSKKVGALVFSRYSKYKNVAVSDEAYVGSIKMPFEGRLVYVPQGYDEILRLWYGDDYMKPKNEPAFHSTFIDPDNDYKMYNAGAYDLVETENGLEMRLL